MSQLAVLTSLAVAVMVTLWTARAVLGAIVTLLFKNRTRTKHAASASPAA
jgi:hypothetical protein